MIINKGYCQGKRSFDEAALDKYREMPAYDYSSVSEPASGYFNRLSRQAVQWLQEIFKFSDPGLAEALLYLILAVVLIGAVLLISDMQFRSNLTDHKKYQDEGEFPDNYIKEEFKKLIYESVASGDFRMAIRYLYLDTLTELEKRKLIHCDKWKTTIDYAYELPYSKKNRFLQLAGFFQKSWYGCYEPSKNDYEIALDRSEGLYA